MRSLANTHSTTSRRARACRRAAAAVVAVLCLALAGLPGTTQPAAEAAAAPLQRVIVEFTAGAALEGADVGAAAADARRAAAGRQQAQTLADAGRRGIDVRPRRAHTLLLNAVSAEVAPGDVERLRALPGVAAVHRDRRFRTQLDISVPLIDAPAVWEATDPAGEAVTGAGQVVAVIDTGVDYTHPDLGGGFGPGHKVVAGYDYVNDDGDPMDDHGHGTHVAGIVAASGGVTGVAPGASITAYKALNAGGGGYESDIVAAIEDAADPANPHRADVINLSLGAPDTGGGPIDRAAQNAGDSGVLVVAAAGNDGPSDQSIMSPAAADGVLAVGASISGVRVPEVEVVAPEALPLETSQAPFSANAPQEPLTVELVDVGHGYPHDYAGVDVEGKAVLLAGDVSWGPGQARLAQEHGAVAALVSARPATPVAPGGEDTQPPRSRDARGHDFPLTGGRVDPAYDGRLEHIVVVSMDPSQYGAIERLRVRDDGPVVVRVSGVDATDEIARFSSRGPTRDHRLKPEVVAPGASILSTIPTAFVPEGLWRFSGTSMAAPHVAGAAALLGQLHPGWDAGEVRSALVGPAQPLEGWSPLAQGAGRLDVAASAGAALMASPPALSLGVAGGTAEQLEASATVTVSNPSGVAVEVAFRHEPHGGGATVEVEPATLALPASGREDVTVTLEAPRSGADTDLTGWVVGEVGGDDLLRVPYAAFERMLTVHVTDPVFAEAEALVLSPTADLAAPPEVVVTGPGDHQATVTATHDHDGWWRADLPLGDPGAYEVRASATISDAAPAAGARDRERAGGAAAYPTLTGGATFEVLAEHLRLRGNAGWQPVGPDSEGGQLVPAGPRGMTVATEGPSRLFTTADKGRTWRQHGNLPVAMAQTGYVAVDPTDPRRMYYAVNGDYLDLTYEGRVLATADGGETWETLPFPDVEVGALHVDARGEVLAAVTADGVSVSSDRGRSWEARSADFGHTVIGRDSVLAGGDLYVALFTGLWVLRDVAGGTSEPELLWEPPGFYHNVDAVTGDGRWLFASSLDGWTGRVHRSGDGGATWEPVLETEGPVMNLDLVGGQLIATGHGLMLASSDAGATWSEREEPVEGSFVLGAATWEQPGNSGKAPGRRGRDPEVLLGLKAAGVWSSTGTGADWQRIGVQGATVYDLAVAEHDGTETLHAATRQGSYRTPAPTAAVTPAVRDWGTSGGEAMLGVDVAQVTASPAGAGLLFRTVVNAMFSFTIERSVDGGETWETLHVDSERPLALLVHPAAPERVYVSYTGFATTGLIVSEDGGASWHVHLHRYAFVAVAGDPRDPDRLWLGNRLGLYRSDDGGVTVELVEPGPVSAIEIDPRTPDRIVVGGERLRVSEDGGASFRAAEHADLPMLVSTVVTSPADADLLVAGTRDTDRLLSPRLEWEYLPRPGRGVLVSRDGGQSWENLSDTLQNRSVTSLAMTGDGKYLFAGTTGGGVHRLRVR